MAMRDILRGTPAQINHRLAEYAYQLQLAADDPPKPVTKMQRERYRLTREVERLQIIVGDDWAELEPFILSAIRNAEEGFIRESFIRDIFADDPRVKRLVDYALRLLAMKGLITIHDIDSRGSRFWKDAGGPRERRPPGRPKDKGTHAVLALEVGESYKTSLKPSVFIGRNAPVTRRFPKRRFKWSSDAFGIITITRLPDGHGPAEFKPGTKRRPPGYTRHFQAIRRNLSGSGVKRFHVVGPKEGARGESYLGYADTLSGAVALATGPMIRRPMSPSKWEAHVKREENDLKRRVREKEISQTYMDDCMEELRNGNQPKIWGRVYTDAAELVWGEEPGDEQLRMIEEREKR